MKYSFLFSIVFVISLLFFSCSDLKDDIAAPPEITTHGDGVFNPASSNFHGKQLVESKNNFEDCKQCHSADLSGGTAKVSCVSSGCHPSINVHKDGMNDPQSQNFHGKFIADNFDGNMTTCASCHGSTYQGGVVSPSCQPCHPSINVHKSGFINPNSPNFHGKYIVDNFNSNMTTCGTCHGATFQGGVASPSCAKCHSAISVHQDGIFNPNSNNFHGKFIANISGGMSTCSTCHGSSFQGGIAAPSCATCHSTINVHQDGIINPSSPNFHGKYIATNLGWDMRVCGSCHAANYSGGIAATSCLTCHTGNNGPEACNTCHGQFGDPTKIAPPRALNGSTSTTYAGVGAHVSHLYQNNLGDVIRCSTCHTVPSSVYAAGHLDTDGKAEIKFGRLAVQGGATPSYSYSNNTCSNTYCHGNFSFSKANASQDPVTQFIYISDAIVGNNATVTWNKVDGTQAKCGSCHGLPPTGHYPVTLDQCYGCHQGVVDPSGNIIDPTKHINGVVNVFGN